MSGSLTRVESVSNIVKINGCIITSVYLMYLEGQTLKQTKFIQCIQFLHSW